MIAGVPTSFDEPRQQIVYAVATALVAAPRLPRGLFDHATDPLSHAGLTDLAVLIGYFTSPVADARGLRRAGGRDRIDRAPGNTPNPRATSSVGMTYAMPPQATPDTVAQSIADKPFATPARSRTSPPTAKRPHPRPTARSDRRKSCG